MVPIWKQLMFSHPYNRYADHAHGLESWENWEQALYTLLGLARVSVNCL